MTCHKLLEKEKKQQLRWAKKRIENIHAILDKCRKDDEELLGRAADALRSAAMSSSVTGDDPHSHYLCALACILESKALILKREGKKCPASTSHRP